MRKYLKPAMEMEAFDLRDVITASEFDDLGGGSNGTGTTDVPGAAPIVVDFN